MGNDDTPAPTVFEEDGFLYTVTNGTAAILRFPEGFSNLSKLPLSLGGYPVNSSTFKALEWPEPPLPVPPPSLPPVYYEDGECEYRAPEGGVYDATLTELLEVSADMSDLVISSSVKTIASDSLDKALLNSIRVEDGNKRFSSCDGLLFNADKTELLKVPHLMKGVCRIPAGVKKIAPRALGFLPCVTAFEVDSRNESYRSAEGVLYDREMTELVAIPDNFPGVLRIPDGIKQVHSGHFDNIRALTGIRLPSSVNKILGEWHLWAGGRLTAIDVDPGNPVFSSNEGVLFSKDMTLLIRCPPGKTGCYAIPSRVNTLAKHAFYNCSRLERIDIPPKFQFQADSVFGTCEERVRVARNRDTVAYDSVRSRWHVLEISEGPCYFRSNRAGECVLTGLDEATKGIVVIPNQFAGRPLTRMAKRAVSFVPEITSITIPSSVHTIDSDAFYQCDRLSDINVDSDNPFFSSFDGCLFDQELTRLIRCPCGKEGVLRLPASVQNISPGAYSGCVKLTAFEVAPQNPSYSSLDGVLFDKTMRELIRCPQGKSDVFKIPSSVEEIWDPAFSGCDKLAGLTAPTRKLKTTLKICESYNELVKRWRVESRS